MRAFVPGLTMFAMTLAAPEAFADPLCNAVTKLAAAAPSGFAAIRGPVNAAAHTSSFDVYAARAALPGAKDCGITVPEELGLGPPSYACEFSSAARPRTTMARLATKLARCIGADIPLPPSFVTGPQGPGFGFTAKSVRYDLSAARTGGKTGPWVVTLNIAPGER